MAIQKMDGANTDARPGAADLTGKEMRVLTRNSANKFAVCGAAGIPAGVCQEGKVAALWSSIAWGGLMRVIAGAAITAGVRVNSDSEGRAVAGTTNSFGIATEEATAAGQVIAVQWDMI